MNDEQRRISSAALRDGPFLTAPALFLADVHSAHCTRNALQRSKNNHVAMLGFYVNRLKLTEIEIETLRSVQFFGTHRFYNGIVRTGFNH